MIKNGELVGIHCFDESSESTSYMVSLNEITSALIEHIQKTNDHDSPLIEVLDARLSISELSSPPKTKSKSLDLDTIRPAPQSYANSAVFLDRHHREILVYDTSEKATTRSKIEVDIPA